MAESPPHSHPDRDLVLVGRVRRPHGVRGEVVVDLLTDEPDAIFASGRRLFVGTIDGDLDADVPPLVVRASRPFKRARLVTTDAIPDRDAADAWRGRYLLVPRAELRPPAADEVFLHDLVGMRVELVSGEAVGAVTAYFELPQGIILEVQRVTGAVLIPFLDHVVREVDVAGARLVIDPPVGLLE